MAGPNVLNDTDMKKIISIIAAAALCLGLVSCNKNLVPDGADTTTVRVSVTPDPGTIPAAGSSFEAVVVVNQGLDVNVDWTVSVDGNPDWVSVSTKKIATHFTGTYAGDDKDVEQNGIACTVSANTTGKKRSAVIRFTTKNGWSDIYTLNQGAK